MSTLFAGNKNSSYDSELIIKDVHEYHGQALRVFETNTLIKNYFTHFRVEYDGSNRPSLVNYFRGTSAHSTAFTAASASQLDGKYFLIYSAPDNQKYAVWYNVDGLSTQPVVSNAKYIEVEVNGGDDAGIVAFATTIVLNLYKDKFTVTRNYSNVQILNSSYGKVTVSDPGTTPFAFIQVNGTEELVTTVEIPYSGSDPVYQGQVLKGCFYDVYSGKFLPKTEINLDALEVNIKDLNGDQLNINPDGSINVNVVRTDQVLKSYFNEIDGIVTGVTEELISYTATADVYLQKIEFSGTNIAQFELVIDSSTVDKKRTFFNGNLENLFNFNEGLNVASGSVIKVYVVHDRPEPGSFNARMQILE